jgi:malate dehydrogenase (oxaloacetate-decarboxylating)
VAVVTDGSAVLGLGNIGPEAALPVMEGKALLFKRFANIDAWPVCLATQDVDEIVRIVQCIAPVYGGINLEDISAPRCFEVEARLRDLLDIPVFHDDQHGTATVVYAALLNALRVVGKQMKDVRIVVLGVGAAGVAISKLLLAVGVGDIVGVNRHGILDENDARLDEDRRWLAANTNREKRRGDLSDAMTGADVLIGVSGPDLVSEAHLKVMAPKSIVFALANPNPEVDPVLARKYAAIVATGRSDEPNQINNVLAFPGIFRGLLDVGASKITEQIEIAAGRAIADAVKENELSADYIVPTVFNPNVVKAVAAAVEAVARESMRVSS